MKTGRELIATGLAAAVVATGGCEAPKGQSTTQPKQPATTDSKGSPGQLRVGTEKWVTIKELVVADKQFNIGDRCFAKRGARLVIKGSSVVYQDENAWGTECPDDSIISMTPAEATTQNGKYNDFERQKQQVTDQTSKMSDHHYVGKSLSADNVGWVSVVNASPVTQKYTNGTEQLNYGDKCIATGTTGEIGRLTTGEIVMKITNPNQLGTECPTGTLYLK